MKIISDFLCAGSVSLEKIDLRPGKPNVFNPARVSKRIEFKPIAELAGIFRIIVLIMFAFVTARLKQDKILRFLFRIEELLLKIDRNFFLFLQVFYNLGKY
jgi:hypothetical protein